MAEEIGRKQGGWYEYAKVNTFASGHWIGVPQFIISWAITYREDWLKEAGFEYPKTWDDFRKVGRALKAKGKPFGQAFGHSINDPNNWCYPMVWMWGGGGGARRPLGGAQQQEHARGREVQHHAVEGSLRRGRPGLGRQ